MHHCWSYWLKLAGVINASSYLNNLMGHLSASHDSRDTITRPSTYGHRLAGIWLEKYTVRFRKTSLKVQFHSSKLDPHATSMNVLMSGENCRITVVLTRLMWDRWAGKGRENRRQEVISHTWHKRISSAKWNRKYLNQKPKPWPDLLQTFHSVYYFPSHPPF